MSKNGTLSNKQQSAIVALLQSTSVAEAAQNAGISTTTLYRWMDDRDFTAALSEAQGQAISAAVRSLTGLSERAIAVIQSVLDDQEASHSTRLRAAGMALEFLLRLKDSHEFEERLRQLEASK